MSKIKVLLAGESWVSTATHVKGFDQFYATDYQTGIGGLVRALEGSDVELVHMPGHLVATEFPLTKEGLAAYDVVVLSDIGANTILLHPNTFLRGQRMPNRLNVIADWVADGGGFIMIGGYYSFQGIYGAARFAGTAIEEILPVAMSRVDDRVETPEGFFPEMVADHPVLSGIQAPWPYLLGFNETTLKPSGKLVLEAGTSRKPLLALGSHGLGRTAAWTSDIGPHWLPDTFMQWPGYGLLWRQLFGWLAGIESDAAAS